MMKKFIDIITGEVADAFEKAGYDRKYARVTVSNRPDLCEFQCNGAMAAKKEYGKAPINIAGDVVKELQDSSVFEKAEAVMPGFINLDVSPEAAACYITEMSDDSELGVEKNTEPKTVIIDYGGPNVAKPLHVGHLRSAVIGESLKRLGRRMGDRVIGDVHLGDWGLQMGLIITELHERQPGLPYFDENFEGEYPKEAPFTISELEEIYPAANKKSKEDAGYKEKALQATADLQNGRRGYRALWKHIMRISVADLKENYRRLDVEFDLWKGESDADPYIAPMVQKMKDDGYAYEDNGALIVDVKEDGDQKEVPPCMILKSDGAALYTTTDLATIVERMQDYHPDEILYVVDKRQEMHFIQTFRCARKTGIVGPDTELDFLGFGTMNGPDGKPFKTRDGGVMRLEILLNDIEEAMYKKIVENKSVKSDDARATAKIVGLAAIKYGDLSNQASKDYIFDVDRFTSFEGNTGPYILYTIVRIKSILAKYRASGKPFGNGTLLPASSAQEKKLMLQLARYGEIMRDAYEEKAPHRLCAYIYELSNDFNSFYHESRILTEGDSSRQQSWIRLIETVEKVLEDVINVLGFSAPEKM